jgi:hypothetical protein
MKIRLVGAVTGLNVEHRTLNFQRPILMALRLIYLNQVNHAEDVI